MATFPSKTSTAAHRDNCPESFDEVGFWSNRSYLYLFDNEGRWVRQWQGKPIIIGFPPEFPTKLEVTSCRDDD